MAPPRRLPGKKEAEPCIKPSGKPCTDKEKAAAAAGKVEETMGDNDDLKRQFLPGPSQSPRDPNMYRVMRLPNGLRIGLSSTCEFNTSELDDNKKVNPCASLGRVKTGTRSKCRRTRSDFDTPKNKRSRADKSVVRDVNCVDEKIQQFNLEVLHICDTAEECKPKPQAGLLSMLFVCCNPTLAEDLSVEGDADQPIESPAEVAGASDASPSEPNDFDENAEYQLNPWNKADRLMEDDENDIPKPADPATPEFDVCSISITLPWGPIFETDEAPGVSELCRKCIQSCEYAHPLRQEELITYTTYVPHSKDIKHLDATVQCLATKFSQPHFDKACIDKVLKQISSGGGSYPDRLKEMSWGKLYDNLLVSPKRIKLLSILSKPDHPIRRIGLGGKSNKHLHEIQRNVLERAMHDYFRTNCKPKHMTIAIEAPETLNVLEEITIRNFKDVGNTGISKNPEPHKVEGEPEPFNTPEFRKFYKVWPCPTKCEVEVKPTGNWLILAFPLPPDAWRNYKTKPLVYLTYVIGHKGFGGLYEYLHRKNWIYSMQADCSQTQFHRNQFCSLFEISVALTDDGLEQYFEVLLAIFSYLKMLSVVGPKKKIYKELQRIQAIDFHSLGKNLGDIKMMRDARAFSRGLQFSASEDAILADAIMTSYNGQLLSQYIDAMKPEDANIMLVSNSFDEAEMDLEEPFLGTKFAALDFPEELATALKNVTPYPEFVLPGENKFIPENFCTPGLEESGAKEPIWISGDDFHDLWHLPDARYKTRTGAIIHFVSPLSMINIESACQMTLFYRVYRSILRASLYPAKIANVRHALNRTDFGIITTVEANADRLGMAIGVMANNLADIVSYLTPEVFEKEKAISRKKICCLIKDPGYFAHWLHTAVTLLNSWCPSNYLPILDDLTLENFNSFIDAVRKDLYFMCLVVGNAQKRDAQDLSDSLLKIMNRDSLGYAIEQVEVLMWPLGEHIIKVRGFGPSSTNTLLNNYYQLGLATARTIVLAKLVQPWLQEYFLKNTELTKKGIFVLVGTNQIHNVLELQIQTSIPPGMTAIEVNDLIEDELVEFSEKEVCGLKPKDLNEMKDLFLCSCKSDCSWFTSGSNLSLWSHGVRNLNMISTSTEIQAKRCVCLNVKSVQNWYRKYLLEPDDSEDISDDIVIPERRKLTIIVLNNPEKKKASEEIGKSLGPKKKKVEKKKAAPCSKEACQELEIIFEASGDEKEENDEECSSSNDKKDKPKKKKVQAENENPYTYVNDLNVFKEDCFIFPSFIPHE